MVEKTRAEFFKNAQSERYKWAKKVDPKAVAEFERRLLKKERT